MVFLPLRPIVGRMISLQNSGEALTYSLLILVTQTCIYNAYSSNNIVVANTVHQMENIEVKDCWNPSATINFIRYSFYTTCGKESLCWLIFIMSRHIQLGLTHWPTKACLDGRGSMSRWAQPHVYTGATAYLDIMLMRLSGHVLWHV